MTYLSALRRLISRPGTWSELEPTEPVFDRTSFGRYANQGDDYDLSQCNALPMARIQKRALSGLLEF